jgi:undecaprenyl-phosphate 4-deoxy-4-formamido-L-arabinose transferase
MKSHPIELSIVVTVYNSEEIIPELISRITKSVEELSISYELILTDDCSSDKSWSVIINQAHSNKPVSGLRLSKNYGQWRSTLAGISRARGKYIVTIDDDLEYEPREIANLYRKINSNDLHVVFGMPKDKYLLQGKNPKIALLRKKIMHLLWNSPPTDSFRIFNRNLVFDKNIFLPDVFIDAFIVKYIDKRFVGYVETASNKRFAGKSNVSLVKRFKLFFLYRTHFPLTPTFYFFLIFLILISSVAAILIFGIINILFLFVGIYLMSGAISRVPWNSSKQPLFVIIDETK